VEDYIFYMKDQQLHDTTINTNLRMVRAFLYWCMEKGYLEKYPIRLVRADDPIKEPYTTDELQKLLKEPDCKTCSLLNTAIGSLSTSCLGPAAVRPRCSTCRSEIWTFPPGQCFSAT